MLLAVHRKCRMDRKHFFRSLFNKDMKIIQRNKIQIFILISLFKAQMQIVFFVYHRRMLSSAESYDKLLFFGLFVQF